MRITETDVLVVGAGPVGLTASALLASYGINALTVTKHASTSTTPRAHIINQRTMEVFRDLGIEDEVRRVATPTQLAGGNIWAVSFSGIELARLSAWGTDVARSADYEAASPCQMCNAPQHVLEPVILAGAREAGAGIRFGVELTAIDQKDDYVLATVRDRSTGDDYPIRAGYAIGADGGRSTVAQQAGFEFEGETGVLNWAANVWLEADLTEYCAYRPSILYWIYEPGEDVFSSTWICVRPWTEWVMSIVYPASRGEPHLDEKTALEYARRMIGDPSIKVRVKAISPWSIKHAVAIEYRRARIFLAGDSAHRHPPPNALGLNTGVQDTFNLCWKLAMVLSGQAGVGLLDTYHAERRPVGCTVVDRVMKSLWNMEPLARAFGLEQSQSEEEGWAKLTELASDGEQGRKRRQLLRDALKLQQYQYNCHGVEYGQRYTSGAVIAGGGSLPVPARDPQLYYQASTFPGLPLPHVWIERKRTPLSTLDVVGHGKFTVITGIGGQEWLNAAQQVSRTLGVPIATAAIDYHQTYHDAYGAWADIREIDETGCLVVRPDRHIAWRAHNRAADPIRELTNVMKRLLDRMRHP